jgi:nucleoside-diphosphate-sugar epimerase
MAMPDAVAALLALAEAPRDALTKTAYNLAAFSPSAAEIRDVVLRAFPAAAIDYDVDLKRQSIVDSWPTDVDDSAARADWRFAPAYDLGHAFSDYLIPTVRRRYGS